MSAHKLLSLLQKVKKTGPGRWIACCPAHQDRRPSLAIRELEDGRLLLHDFAGCSAAEVLAAIGLSLKDLFPERPSGHGDKKVDRPWFAIDVLRCVAFEALVVAIAANSVAHGEELQEADRKRLLVAAARLQAGLEVANGDS
jgi:hypothetical protein